MKARRRTKLRKTVEEYADMLRSNMTKAEEFLWTRLKKEQRDWNHKFQPQVPVHGYIPDFYCETLQLAVEIDGKIHFRRNVKSNDRLRTQVLNRMGVTVIRFKNSDVFSTVSDILRILKEVCE